MRIAHLISQYLPNIGGAQICIHNVTGELIKKGDDVVVITTTQDQYGEDYGYPIIRISNWYLKALRFPIPGKYLFWFRLWLLQAQHKFDLWLVTVGYPIGVHAVSFFEIKKIPCLLRCCGEDIQVDKEISYGYRLSPQVDRLVRECYPKFNGFIALTESVRKEYEKLNIPERKIRIIPNGANLTRFNMPESRESIRERLGLNSKKVLLTVGRNHPKKGYDLIPRILKIVFKVYDDIVWIVIGKGCNWSFFADEKECSKDLMILIDELPRLKDESALDMPSKNLIEYYNSADIFVFPSYIETFGMVLIEANAAGVPVVTTDAPGCRDVIIDGYNGLLSRPGDVEMFAEKIIELFKNKDLYSKIRENMSQNIKDYNWSDIASAYRNYYADILEHSK